MNKTFKFIINLVALGFFLDVILNINLEIFTSLVNKSGFFIVLSFFCFTISQFIIGLTWSYFIQINYKINKITSFLLWINSIAAKYIPGKVASSVLRLQHNEFKKNKLEFYNHILVESICLALTSITIGAYGFFNQNISLTLYLFVINFVFLLITNLKNIEIKKVNFLYFKNIFYFELVQCLNILGVYFLILPLKLQNTLIISFLYVFVSGISMLIFIIPAGIGVRENLFVELGSLTNSNLNTFSSISIALRIQLIFVDLFFVIASYFVNFKFSKD